MTRSVARNHKLTGGSGKPKGLDGGFYVKSIIFADVTNEMTI
ncbi:hypothetical protein [Peribacillus simplex]